MVCAVRLTGVSKMTRQGPKINAQSRETREREGERERERASPILTELGWVFGCKVVFIHNPLFYYVFLEINPYI